MEEIIKNCFWLSNNRDSRLYSNICVLHCLPCEMAIKEGKCKFTNEKSKLDRKRVDNPICDTCEILKSIKVIVDDWNYNDMSTSFSCMCKINGIMRECKNGKKQKRNKKGE